MPAVRSSDLLINGKRYSLAEGSDAYLIDVATPLAPKVVTGDYDYSDFTAYSMLAQSAMQGGAGQFEIGDPAYFHWSERLDTRGERITLGVKVSTMQPTVLEGAGTLGKPHIPGNALNAVCANETYENRLEWLTLGLSMNKAAGRWKAEEVSPGEPAPIVPSLLAHFDANVGITKTGVEVETWNDQNAGYKVDVFGGSVKFVDNVTAGMPMIQGSGGGLYGALPMAADTPRTIVMVLKLPLGSTPSGLFGFGDDWVLTGAKQWYVYHGDGNMTISVTAVGLNGVVWDAPLSEDTLVVLSIRTRGERTSSFHRAWYNSVMQPEPTHNDPEIYYGHGPALTLFCAGRDGETAQLPSDVMIGEMFICTEQITPDERYLFEEYLKTKWIDAAAFWLPLVIETPTDIERPWLYLRTSTSLDSGAVVVNLLDDDGGLPGTVLSTATVDKEKITGAGSWVQVPLTSIALTPGDYYHLQLDCTALLCYEAVDWLVGEDVRALGLGGLTTEDYDSGVTHDATRMPLFLGQYPDLAPDIPARKFIEYRGKAETFYVYNLAGKRIYRIRSPLSQTPVRDATGIKMFGADATDMITATPDYAIEPDVTPKLLIALGVDTDMEVWDGDIVDGSGWETITGWQAHRLLFFDNFYWRASYDEERGWFVQGSTEYNDWTPSLEPEGLAGEWGVVGDSRWAIDALFAWKGQLYAGRADGLYILTPEPGYPASGKLVVTKQLDLSSEAHPNNFKAHAIWHDDLYFSLGHGVAKLTSGNVFSSVGPERGLGEGGLTRGSFTSFHSTLTQMFATYTGNENQWSSIMAYTGGWHIIASSGRVADAMGAVFVDSGVYSEFPALWTTSHALVCHSFQPSESLRRWTYVNRELGNSSPILFYDRSPGNNFSEAPGILISSWFSGRMGTIVKSWTVLDVDADSMGTEQRIELYYRTDEEMDFVHFGDVTVSGLTRVALPTDASSLKIQLAYRFFTNQTYVSPVFVGSALRYTERPDLAERVQVTLVLSDCLRHTNGHKDSRSAAMMYDDLLEARRNSSPIKLVLLDGRELMCDISSMTSTPSRRYEHNKSVLDLAYIVRLSLLESPGVPVPPAS